MNPVAINPKARKATLKAIFQIPNSADWSARLYYRHKGDTTTVTNGHWLLTVPSDSIPGEFMYAMKGKKGKIDADGWVDAGECPDFSAVIPAAKGYVDLEKTPIVFAGDGFPCEAEIHKNGGPAVYCVNRKYMATIENLFPGATLQGKETDRALRIVVGGEFVGVIMPLRNDAVLEALGQINGRSAS